MMITNVQRMSLDDGPGIRSTVFVKGCPLRCKWCHNPECMEAAPAKAFARSFPDSFVYDGDAAAFCERLARDRRFFEATGGGVTISGGEPLLYPDFVADVGRGLSQRGIGLAVDTCGYVPWSSFERALSCTDLFLYDLKASDSGLHERLTGRKNELIWENLDRLLACDREIWVRVPAVKGANSGQLKEIAERLPVHKNITRVELLPYHAYGLGKYPKAGIEYQGDRYEVPKEECFAEALEILTEKGIRCFVQGYKFGRKALPNCLLV